MFFIILAVFLSLSLIVFFHEFGHFIFCQIFFVRVEEFGFGYAPRMIGLVKRDGKWKVFFGKQVPKGEELGTIYSLNWIPFGGFNRIKGEIGEERIESDSFAAKPWWQRSIIALGGVFFNIILTLLLFTFVFIVGSYQVLPEGQKVMAQDVFLQVVEVIENSPAKEAGLRLGDKILAVDGKRVDEVSAFQNYVKDKLGLPIKLIIKRGDKLLEIENVPLLAQEIFEDKTMSGAAIGIALVKVGRVSYRPFSAFWQAIKKTGLLFYQIVATIAGILKDLFIGQRVNVEVVGVVGLAALTGKIAQMGFVYLLQFVAIISLLIAFTQLIPFPAIDGGRIVFFILEGIRRKPIDRKIEAAINNIGFVALIILMLLITYQDITRLGSGFFDKILSQ